MSKKVLPWRARLSQPDVAIEGKARWLLRGEGFLLASVPVVGTMLALMFEWGFLSFYRIPLSIATLDISHIFRASALTGLGIVALIFLRLLMHRWDNSSHISLRIVGSSWPWVWGTILLASLLPTYWWFPFAMILFMAIGTVYNGLWLRKHGEVLRESILRILDNERERLPPGPARWSSLGKALFVAYSLLMCLTLVKTYGLRSAEWREEYLVLKDDPAMAFVERYGENLVFAKYDPSTKRLSGEILMRNYSEGGVHLLLQRVGPLVAASSPAPKPMNSPGR